MQIPLRISFPEHGAFLCRGSDRPREGRQIDIGVPGNDAHVNEEGQKNKAHEDINVAIRDAFDAAVHKLEDHVRRLRSDVNSHVS